MEYVLDAAFIIATVAFFKTQFGFSGKVTLLAAFVVALIVGLAPTITAQFPNVAPWITQIAGVIVLFISSAGTVDALGQFRRIFAEPLNAKGAQPK
jgi:hypothetical protein